LAEFASIKELTVQTGHGVEDWPLVIIKELTDNGIDAAETHGVAPIIKITAADGLITVADNGAGLSPEAVDRIVDFGKRTSTNEAYASPTRGRQGNAIQTVLSMPFAMDTVRDQPSKTLIESRGFKHTVTFEADAVRHIPKVLVKREKSPVQNGTKVTVRLPGSARLLLQDAKSRIVQMAEGYGALNPHLEIQLRWESKAEVTIKAANPRWAKWLPSHPTPPHWYDFERFNRLIAATIAHDQDTGRDTLVRGFIATFRGMARSASQKAVLDKVGASRMSLAALFNEGRNRVGVGALLSSLKVETKAVKPVDLGMIGRDHMATCCERAGGNLKTFEYGRIIGATGGLPWVVEVGFAYRPVKRPTPDDRRLVVGTNFSPGLRNPFPNLNAVLVDQRAYQYPVVVVAHLVCPVLSFADRGKSRLVLSEEMAKAVTDAVVKATTRWRRQIKAEERDNAAISRREEKLARSKSILVKDAVYAALPAAYLRASDNGKLPARPRQIYYALRNEVQQRTGKQLDASYMTQVLLPDYLNEHDVSWDIVMDDRGHFIEPHTKHSVGLGTVNVRNYLKGRAAPSVLEPGFTDAKVATSGPEGNYGAVLYIEKEGFDLLFDHVRLSERFDVGIIAAKGMSTTAARTLVENVCGERGIPLFVLHDFDKAGMSIASTLVNDTRRYQFKQAVDVTDIGLRLNDVRAMGLEALAEPNSDRGSAAARRANLENSGATPNEIEFLLRRRVELNAMTTRQLVNFVERKLIQHGVKKVLPKSALLADAYRAFARGEVVRTATLKAIQEAERDAGKIAVPKTLQKDVGAMLKKNPTMRWDQAVAKIAREE
jgi:DNA topoisomerase VI subunit B/DNA topoisomerase VI subunit A